MIYKTSFFKNGKKYHYVAGMSFLVKIMIILFNKYKKINKYRKTKRMLR
jgi:hypothetical protein